MNAFTSSMSSAILDVNKSLKAVMFVKDCISYYTDKSLSTFDDAMDIMEHIYEYEDMFDDFNRMLNCYYYDIEYWNIGKKYDIEVGSDEYRKRLRTLILRVSYDMYNLAAFIEDMATSFYRSANICPTFIFDTLGPTPHDADDLITISVTNTDGSDDDIEDIITVLDEVLDDDIWTRNEDGSFSLRHDVFLENFEDLCKEIDDDLSSN